MNRRNFLNKIGLLAAGVISAPFALNTARNLRTGGIRYYRVRYVWNRESLLATMRDEFNQRCKGKEGRWPRSVRVSPRLYTELSKALVGIPLAGEFVDADRPEAPFYFFKGARVYADAGLTGYQRVWGNAA